MQQTWEERETCSSENLKRRGNFRDAGVGGIPLCLQIGYDIMDLICLAKDSSVPGSHGHGNEFSGFIDLGYL